MYVPITQCIALDFETCGVVDLRKTGARRYAQDKWTDLILYAYQPLVRKQTGSGPRTSKSAGWMKYEEVGPAVLVSSPTCAADIRQGCEAGTTLWIAHNVEFERAIWEEVLTPFHDWPACPPLSQWRDTMAMAAAAGLPLGLEAACGAAGLAVGKDTDGHALMLRMARPRGYDEAGDPYWWHEQDPPKKARLGAYCMADVEAEVALLNAVPDLRPREQSLWELTTAMNEVGVSVDLELVRAAQALSSTALDRANREVARLTNGYVKGVNASVSMRDWLEREGQQAVPDVSRKTVERLLQDRTWFGLARDVLEIRHACAKSSVAKLNAMESFASAKDSRMRGLLAYAGAFRTGRWAGRGPQVQNYTRPPPGLDVDLCVSLVRPGTTVEALEFMLDMPALEALSGLLRACLWSQKGVLVAADFSAIEARVLPWLAGEQWVLDAFEQGRDVYVETAARMGSDNRPFGKLMVLSAGYQTGPAKLKSTAQDVYGLGLSDEQAVEAIQDWRAANPNIVQLWWALDRAAIHAVRNKTRDWIAGSGLASLGPVAFRMSRCGKHLLMKLPSGRQMVYRDAVVLQDPDFHRPGVTFMGVDTYTRKWTRQRGYGGLWANNATQGTARDVMGEVLLAWRRDARNRTPARYLTPLFTVHDELVCEAQNEDEGRRGLGWLLRRMSQGPAWAVGLPLAAEGYVGNRFRKG